MIKKSIKNRNKHKLSMLNRFSYQSKNRTKKSLSKTILKSLNSKKRSQTKSMVQNSTVKLYNTTANLFSIQAQHHNRITNSVLSYIQTSDSPTRKCLTMNQPFSISKIHLNLYIFLIIQNPSYTKARTNLAQCY